MAKHLSINNVDDSNGNVRLQNGYLVLVEGVAYLITSYTELNEYNQTKYCCFVDLKTGSKAFSEPSSRQTTFRRILEHLKHRHPRAKTRDIIILDKEDYSIEINVH